jgi:hypothetical protein
LAWRCVVCVENWQVVLNWLIFFFSECPPVLMEHHPLQLCHFMCSQIPQHNCISWPCWREEMRQSLPPEGKEKSPWWSLVKTSPWDDRTKFYSISFSLFLGEGWGKSWRCCQISGSIPSVFYINTWVMRLHVYFGSAGWIYFLALHIEIHTWFLFLCGGGYSVFMFVLCSLG